MRSPAGTYEGWGDCCRIFDEDTRYRLLVTAATAMHAFSIPRYVRGNLALFDRQSPFDVQLNLTNAQDGSAVLSRTLFCPGEPVSVTGTLRLTCAADTRRHRMPHLSMRVAALVLALLTTASAHAHQLWLEHNAQGTRLYFGEFGDNLREVSPGRLDKFVGLTAMHLSAKGERARVDQNREGLCRARSHRQGRIPGGA